MPTLKPNILRINVYDRGGGAERTTMNLHHACKAHGYPTQLVVRRKTVDDPDVMEIPNDAYRSLWTKGCLKLRHELGKRSPTSGIAQFVEKISEPRRRIESYLGIQNGHAPATRRLVDLLPQRPDIVHCHNLHGRYFDLDYLPHLSHAFPVIITLHDAWLLAGGCIHSFACERWRQGCGQCPHLDLVTRSGRDATHYNWQKKKAVYGRSRFYVASASQWMLDRARASILAPAIIESRVIPNGVDLSIFSPGERDADRERLALPRDAKILLFSGSHVNANVYKDYKTVERAALILSRTMPDASVVLCVIGSAAEDETKDRLQIRHVSFLEGQQQVAQYCRAADVYLHAAKAEVFGNSIIEAMACGTPVVATEVGGIPEILTHGENGYLTPPGDAEAMASAVRDLLENKDLYASLSAQCLSDAQSRFNRKTQASAYLQWYDDIFEATHKVLSEKS